MTAWYPVALAADLAPGEVAGTRLLGREIALWRDAEGRPHAWEDRCPHRGMRLSFGFVRDGRLACLYHGWRFDGEGRCRVVPAHPELSPPSTIRATRHGCAEAAGIVWATAEPAEDPPPPPAGDRPAHPVRSIFLDIDAAAAEALAQPILAEDPLLFAAVHPRSAREAALHVVRCGPALPAEALRALARRLAALRRLAEAA
jgi:phenylpropionate dioxygenase-like ring-hydroxylating dioxygenase large terminal subunit